VDNTFLVSQDHKELLLYLPEYLESHGGAGADSTVLKDVVTAFFRQMSEETPEHDPFAFKADTFEYHSRAFLKIQDGCDNHCTYCRVTLARGDSFSLPLQEILERIALLEKEGYREIVLTGVNLTSWREPFMESSFEGSISGEDSMNRRLDFADMLFRVLEQVKECRIRLTSLEPETISERMAGVLSHPNLCPHFHISVQSGSDDILKRMCRKNNRAKIIRGVELLKKACINPFLAADIIVGFPGETENDFNDSYNLMKELEFSELHVFPFSPRPGTAALTMTNPVPERITGERTSKIRALSTGLHVQYLKSCEGKSYGFLLEQPVEKDEPSADWYGISANYLKLPVKFSSQAVSSCDQPEKGRIVRAKVMFDQEQGYYALPLVD